MEVMVVTTLLTVHDAPGTVPGTERVSRSDHAIILWLACD